MLDRIEVIPPRSLRQIERERDLYGRLLDLGDQEDLDVFLGEALGLVLEATAAHHGYIELMDEEDSTAPLQWSAASNFSEDDLHDVRKAISAGIVAKARAEGKTIFTASAFEDPRFHSFESVRLNGIEAVICAPLGRSMPLGVLYLQGGTGRGPFSEDDRKAVETFSRHISPFAERLLLRRRQRDRHDPTRPLRAKLSVEGVIGRSAALASVLQQVAIVAPYDAGVLLTGPSGTGKTRIARVIHDNGPRKNGPFLELNVSTLPENLLENELFGAVQGAHTGASKKVVGKVEAAQGGTLFLDEIGELPLALQAKLLQLLNSKDYFPLGSAKSQKADIRILAATNADIARCVAERRFRDDLYYRLNVFPIRIPALRERREDIPDLMEHFCHASCDAKKRARLRFSPAAIQSARSADWPGNVRELENNIEAAVLRAVAEGADVIDVMHLFLDPPVVSSSQQASAGSYRAATRGFQADFLRTVLGETGWDIALAAGRLDMARSSLYGLIKEFGLRPKSE